MRDFKRFLVVYRGWRGCGETIPSAIAAAWAYMNRYREHRRIFR